MIPVIRLFNAGFDLFLLFVISDVLTFLFPALKYSYWVMAGLFVVLWVARSATNVWRGKALWPLVNRVQLDRPVPWVQALLRNSWLLLAIIPRLGVPLMVLVGLVLLASMYLRSDRRGLHDLWAGTEVRKANKA